MLSSRTRSPRVYIEASGGTATTSVPPESQVIDHEGIMHDFLSKGYSCLDMGQANVAFSERDGKSFIEDADQVSLIIVLVSLILYPYNIFL